MFGARLVIGAEVELLTPLHLGTGEAALYQSIEHDDPQSGSPAPTQVATVMRDVQGFPVIPGASLKGVLRALADSAGVGVDDLFGPPAESGEARQGRLTVRAMRYLPGNKPLQLTDKLPYAGKVMPDGNTLRSRWLFVSARTAIDPGSGTADEGKLFYQEMTAPDARFRLDLALCLDGDSAPAEACLMGVLSALTAEDGVPFGRGQSLGQGRLRLNLGTLSAERLALDNATGALVDPSDLTTTAAVRNAVEEASAPAAVDRHVRWLIADGPFLIDDTSIKHAKDSGKPRLNAQRNASAPLLPGSTLVGALRARAGWLSRLKWTADKAGGDRDRRLARDDEAAQLADPRVVTKPEQLTPTERLFGVTGWRGLVRIASVTCRDHGDFENITSVKLDRFSMAPVDGALFATRAAIDPVFEVTIELERRGGYPNGDDQTLFEELLADLACEGLMLGHGTSRGYGWFKVEENWVGAVQVQGGA